MIIGLFGGLFLLAIGKGFLHIKDVRAHARQARPEVGDALRPSKSSLTTKSAHHSPTRSSACAAA
jgi:hypothetical protein